jgi:SNF2 family DNA or RNA helicase
VLINYDLPWNPQKVEQRIGRVHRYGQKNDVVVVNFVNRKNPADRRVFQLLDEKLQLFEGVFGASDEVLGAIEGSVDIERRIYEIYQKCRSDQEIEYEFDQLQRALEETLAARETAARETLLNNFDRDVVSTLKTLRDDSKDFLQEYERVLLDLARAELPEAEFDTNHIHLDGQRFYLSWPLAEKNDSEFFRLQATEHYLAWDLVHKAKNHTLEPAHLVFRYEQLVDGYYAALKEHIGQSGLLTAFEIQFTYNQRKTRNTRLVVLAQTDDGQKLTLENADHLMCVPAKQQPLTDAIPVDFFDTWQTDIVKQTEAKTEAELDNYLEQESEKLERWAQDRRKALMATVEELDEEICLYKREARQLASTAEKIQAKKELRKLERKRDDALAEYHQSKKAIEREEDRLLDEVSEKLELTLDIKQLFEARWTLTH